MNNSVILRGILYLVKTEHIAKNKLSILCKLTTNEGSHHLLDMHDVILIGRLAIQTLAMIRANDDNPIHILLEGRLLSRNTQASVRARKVTYLIDDGTFSEAQPMIDRIQAGDRFLEESFRDTAKIHSRRLKPFD